MSTASVRPRREACNPRRPGARHAVRGGHVNIPIRWRLDGLQKGTLDVVLSLGGKEVGRKEIPVKPGEDLRDTLAFVVPKGKEAEEATKLTTSITLRGNDQYADSMTKDIRLIDKKIKVLYIENSPRFEYRFLQTALSATSGSKPSSCSSPPIRRSRRGRRTSTASRSGARSFSSRTTT